MEAEKIEGSAFMEYRETMAASSSDEDARMRRDAQETEMKSRNIVKPGRNRQDRNEKGVRRRRGRRNDSNRRKDFGRKRWDLSSCFLFIFLTFQQLLTRVSTYFQGQNKGRY